MLHLLAPQRELFYCFESMKITKFYVDKAKYFAEDESGRKIVVSINYWDGTYKISRKNENLEIFAKKLLKNKHRVNFVSKLVQ